MSGSVLSLEVDGDAGAAYLKLSAAAVARTVAFTDDVFVDLDEHDMVVGVEVLDLTTAVPLDDLAKAHHVRAETLKLLVSAITSSSTTQSAALGGRFYSSTDASQPRWTHPTAVATRSAC